MAYLYEYVTVTLPAGAAAELVPLLLASLLCLSAASPFCSTTGNQ